jgi:hypothetical protein
MVMSGFFAGAVMMTFLCAGREVLRRAVSIREDARRLDNDVDAEILPRQLGGVLDGQDLEVIAGNRDPVRGRADVGVKIAEDRVVLEEVSECGSVGQIVDSDEIDVVCAPSPLA